MTKVLKKFSDYEKIRREERKIALLARSETHRFEDFAYRSKDPDFDLKPEDQKPWLAFNAIFGCLSGDFSVDEFPERNEEFKAMVIDAYRYVEIDQDGDVDWRSLPRGGGLETERRKYVLTCALAALGFHFVDEVPVHLAKVLKAVYRADRAQETISREMLRAYAGL